MELQELPGHFAIARLDAASEIPRWANGAGFVSVTRTEDEVSIICRAEDVPEEVRSEGPWICFKLLGPFDLAVAGIGIRLVRPVSDAGLGFLFVTTFDTDYLFVKASDRADAMAALESEGLSLSATSGEAPPRKPAPAG